ncbi:MAG: CoA-binding protein [Chloroflexi bacterium]|nr:CoA-binding protein [Chloroflexota bacterium]
MMSSDGTLDAIFNPKSVAIAGVGGFGIGQAFLTCLLDSGFKGRIYPLSPKGGEVLGLKVHPNIKDVPDEVDFVISCIPAHLTPQLVEDCVAKGVKAISFYTAGFGEKGDVQGRELDAEILRVARAGGLRILGPNCVGVYHPKVGLSFSSDNPKESGRVGLVCQSGGNIIYTVRAAGFRGVRFSKAVSYGNALDIDETELLEYFGRDSETEVVAVYIEGVKDGTRFFQVLREVSSTKPVVILKAGHTEAGARAVTSHTGALAGSEIVWDKLLDQAGVVRVHSLDELADMLVAFSYLRAPDGRGIAVLGGGGGLTVMTTDEYGASGFSLPPLPRRIQDVIRKDVVEFVKTDAGFILDNPFDLTNLFSSEGQYRVFKRLASCDGIDMLVAQMGINNSGWPYPGYGYSEWPDTHTDVAIRVHNETGKPIAVIIHSALSMWDSQRALDLQQKCCEAGLPVFRSVPSAAKAMDRFMRYHERRTIK